MTLVMLEEAIMGRSRTIALLLLFVLSPVARAAAPVPADRLSELLSTIAEGRDTAFDAAVEPALGVDARLPAAARAAAGIARIAQESDQVTSAFATPAPAV